MNFPGLSVYDARRVIEMEDVLEAKTASFLQTATTLLNIFSLISSSSVAASIIRSAFFKSAIFVDA